MNGNSCGFGSTRQMTAITTCLWIWGRRSGEWEMEWRMDDKSNAEKDYKFSASFPTVIWGRWFLWVASIYPGLVLPLSNKSFSIHAHIPLQPTFLHFLGYFSHLRCPSNCSIPYSVQLGVEELEGKRRCEKYPRKCRKVGQSDIRKLLWCQNDQNPSSVAHQNKMIRIRAQ